MAHFILQTDSNSLDIEYFIIKELLKKNKYLHSYLEVKTDDIKDSTYKEYVPVGDIPFVTKWLKYVHGITRENPIEIPKYLRTDEFLKRDYKIVTWDKIPRTGTFFLKDVSELKSFGNEINATYTDIDNLFNCVPKSKYNSSLVLDNEHKYLVSELFNIQSEYRVYVINGKIEAISNYNGDVTILPDIHLINKAVGLINKNEEWLKSYTIDVMVGPKGTALIEVHNFASVGLYNTLWGDNLLYAYKHGIEYLINDNKEINV